MFDIIDSLGEKVSIFQLFNVVDMDSLTIEPVHIKYNKMNVQLKLSNLYDFLYSPYFKGID